MRNLHKFIKENHGWEALGELWQWERREIKQCNYKNHRIFTLRFISKGLVPVHVKLNSNREDISIGARNIIRRAEMQLLQERVKCINNLLQNNREGIASSKSGLFSIVTNQEIQQQCTEFIDKVREVRFNKVRDRQVGTFTRLLNKNSFNGNSENNNSNSRVRSNNKQVQSNSDSNLDNSSNNNNNNNLVQGSNISNVRSKWVVNLSSSSLTPDQVSLLSKEPNFALAPTNPPNLEFIWAVEAACQRLTYQDAQELKAEVNILLKRAKLPKNNISREERKVLKELSEDQDRMVLMADKGVAIEVMDRKEYQDKVEGLLATSTCRTISTDPTKKLNPQLIQKLRRIKRETNMDEGMYRTMYPTNCTGPNVLWVA